MLTRRTLLGGAVAASAAGGLALPRRAAAQQGQGAWKVGFSLSLTGQYAEVGKYQDEGYELWRRHVNESSEKLLGRPVEFVKYDDQSDPATTSRLFEKLVSDDQVDFVLGPYSSATTQAAAPVVEKHGFPMITAGASSETIFQRGYKNVFMTYSPAGDYLKGAIDICQKRGLKRVAAVNENTLFPKDSIKGAIEQSKKAGLEIVVQEAYPKGVTDLSAVLTKIRDAQAEAIFAGSYFQDAVLLVKTAKELNVNPKMIAVTVGAALEGFGRDLGKDADYIFGSSQWEPDPSLPYPGIKRFIEDYKKAFNREPDYHSSSGYQAGEVLAAALKKIGKYDRKDDRAREALRETIRGLDLMTVNGRFKVDPTGLQVGHDILLIQWQKGKKVVVWPEQYATGPYRFPMPPWNQRS
jgi:branched-chain amino acid transport system substrate-binding protein